MYLAKTIIFQFHRRSNGTKFYPKYCSGMVKEEKLTYAQFKLLEIMFNLHTWKIEVFFFFCDVCYEARSCISYFKNYILKPATKFWKYQKNQYDKQNLVLSNYQYLRQQIMFFEILIFWLLFWIMFGVLQSDVFIASTYINIIKPLWMYWSSLIWLSKVPRQLCKRTVRALRTKLSTLMNQIKPVEYIQVSYN